MKVFAHFPQMRDRWLKVPIGSQRYRPWLTEHGSLTKRLQHHSAVFSVHNLDQRKKKPPLSEASLLGILPRQHTLLRDVMLRCDTEAVVFAHSILPRQAMRGAWRSLGGLGNRSLGGTLFADPRMRRGALQFKKLSPQHALHKRARSHIAELNEQLWARRSVFRLGAGAVLVTELFLPSVLMLVPNSKK